ncbi:hypothetical protein F4777DRAFT_583566 [Nemania sp. FL0916]|nr:hypothetical protein F4777DRAFT_583566 [Nemania sp. FL0916]
MDLQERIETLRRGIEALSIGDERHLSPTEPNKLKCTPSPGDESMPLPLLSSNSIRYKANFSLLAPVHTTIPAGQSSTTRLRATQGAAASAMQSEQTTSLTELARRGPLPTAPATKSPLLNLPAEIRLNIYEFAVVKHGTHWGPPYDYARTLVPPSLARVNRLLRKEVIHEYYRKSEFWIRLPVTSGLAFTTFIERCVLAERYLPLINGLRLRCEAPFSLPTGDWSIVYQLYEPGKLPSDAAWKELVEKNMDRLLPPGVPSWWIRLRQICDAGNHFNRLVESISANLDWGDYYNESGFFRVTKFKDSCKEMPMVMALWFLAVKAKRVTVWTLPTFAPSCQQKREGDDYYTGAGIKRMATREQVRKNISQLDWID